MIKPRITAVVPCFGRPQRTMRIIAALQDQTINDFEVFLVGDHCEHFQTLLDSGFMMRLIEDERQKGNYFHAWNLYQNKGGFGYYIRNLMKMLANGKYLCFIDNDDWIKQYHFQHYLSEIENTDLDFVYYNTWNDALGLIRDTKPTMGLIGHSELCIRTEFFKSLPFNQSDRYGHDWEMIEYMLSITDKHKKSSNPDWTYKIMSTPMKRETLID